MWDYTVAELLDHAVAMMENRHRAIMNLGRDDVHVPLMAATTVTASALLNLVWQCAKFVPRYFQAAQALWKYICLPRDESMATGSASHTGEVIP